jgi:hypothetical protein
VLKFLAFFVIASHHDDPVAKQPQWPDFKGHPYREAETHRDVTARAWDVVFRAGPVFKQF